MEMNFQRMMVKKSDIELEDYLTNILAYSREIVEAAVTEMKKRSRIFTEDELSTIEAKINERENTIGKNTITVRYSLEKYIVEDESALALYSRKTIDWITIFFGIIVGTILMVINLKNTEKKKGIITVLIFGIVYLFFEIYILSLIPESPYSLVNFACISFNGFGAYILHSLIWNKFIGKEYKYRKRPNWFPIVLGILQGSLFLLIWLNSQN